MQELKTMKVRKDIIEKLNKIKENFYNETKCRISNSDLLDKLITEKINLIK